MQWHGIIYVNNRKSFYFLPEILKNPYLNELPAVGCDQARQRTIMLLACFLPLSLDIKFNLCSSNFKNIHIKEITMAFLFLCTNLFNKNLKIWYLVIIQKE